MPIITVNVLQRLVIILAFITFYLSVKSQDTINQASHPGIYEIKPLRFIPGAFRFMDADLMGNLYVLTQTNQLRKYGPSGDSLAAWNDVKNHGNPSFLNVSNPMRILLYFRPFTSVVILDRLLVFRHKLNLRQQNIFRVNAIAGSYDNNIWLFDEQDFKLKKISDEGELLFETADWRLLFSEAPTPEIIRDDKTNVYLYDNDKGVFIFDYYGSLKKKYPVRDLHFPDFSAHQLSGISGENILFWNLDTGLFDSTPSPLPVADIRAFRHINNTLYFLSVKGIFIFSIEKKQA